MSREGRVDIIVMKDSEKNKDRVAIIMQKDEYTRAKTLLRLLRFPFVCNVLVR